MKSKHFLIASIVVYTISLFCPIYFPKDIVDEKIISDDFFGYQAVALGWMLFAYVDFFCWLANFTLLISWIFYRKKFANYLVSIGTFLAFLFGINHVTQLNFMQLREYDLTLFGYWFWIIAMLLQIVATKLFQNEKAIMTDEK